MEQYDVQQIARPSTWVAELKHQVDFLLGQLKVPYVDNETSPQYREMKRPLRKDDEAGAIKVFPSDDHTRLENAKAAVEAIQRAL